MTAGTEITEDELAETEPAVVDGQEETLLANDPGEEEEPDGGEEDGDDLGPDWPGDDEEGDD